MTYSDAARMMTAHGMAIRPSVKPGHIEGLARFSNGPDVWEEIELTHSAIRNWLGY